MVSPVEQSLSQVRTDEAGTTSDQIAQKASWEKSERLGIIIGMMRPGGLRRTIIGCAINFRGFLWTVSVRIRIVAIRIVVIRSRRVDRVQHYAQQTAFHADQQIASACEGFLRRFATPHHQQYAVGLHRKNYCVRRGHYWGR